MPSPSCWIGWRGPTSRRGEKLRALGRSRSSVAQGENEQVPRGIEGQAGGIHNVGRERLDIEIEVDLED